MTGYLDETKNWENESCFRIIIEPPPPPPSPPPLSSPNGQLSQAHA